ncbi:MAG: SDR family NAD(P)-dependent oxidoreductase [Anaerolineaceae bacterium]
MNNKRAIAVVGLGAILPDAYDVTSFWKNILDKKDSIGEVPPDRWSTELYYDPDPSVMDKTYSKIGAFVKGYQFDPYKHGIAIPPRVLALMDMAQQWGLAASQQALKDFGYPDKPLNPERVAVILGNANAGEGHYRSTFRILLPEYLESLKTQPDFRGLPAETRDAILAGITGSIHAKIPAITEDTMPGELSNIIAGRIANVFNFSGPSFVTDAACASSLAALQAAVVGLENHQFDAVLTGGVDHSMGPESYIKFCKIGALSAGGSRPYSDKADGFVMGEGAVIFLLKRLEDAERDGDKIYALIRGIGASSDGKGKGITAPNPLGQQRAIERALLDAGTTPEQVGLIEGHGTSTKVGDVAEVGSLKSVFGSSGLKTGSIALGSVKSNIGHLKSAAGAVGLLKTILALNEHVFPPSANFERPNPNIDFSAIPFLVNTQVREWEPRNGDYRYAGVSSFGFGGTNFHVILEEYLPGILGAEKSTYSIPMQIESEKPAFTAVTPKQDAMKTNPSALIHSDTKAIEEFVLATVSEKTGYPREMLDLELDLEADLGIDTVKQAELFATIRTNYGIPRREDLRLSEYNTLTKVVGFVSEALGNGAIPVEGVSELNAAVTPVSVQPNGSRPANSDRLKPYQGLYFISAETKAELSERLTADLANFKNGILPESFCPEKSQVQKNERLAIDYEDGEELVKRCEKAVSAMQSDLPATWNALQAHGIYRGSGRPGKVVFMFPGQGSQYVNMIRDLRDVEPVVRDTFEEADRILTPILGKPLTEFIYADGSEEALAQAEKELKNTTITQPAVLTTNVALLRVMNKYGFSPDFVIGHSLGEYAALVASGVLSFAEALEVVSARGREMSRIKVDDPGCMAAVSAPLEVVEDVLKTIEGYIVIANVNSPVQSVLGGTTAAIDSAIAKFQAMNLQAVKIPVSHAFHTSIVAPASEPVRQVIERMDVKAPRIPIVANVTGELYPSGRQEITDLLARQVASPVQLVKSMQTLYSEGARVFVEVGPKRVLNALATDNMKGKTDTIILATNHPRKGGQASFNEALCGLYAAGVTTSNEDPSLPSNIGIQTETLEIALSPVLQNNGFAVLTGSVVVSGAGLGLPGRNASVFDDGNIESILDGKMRIDALPESIRKGMLGKRVTRLIKSDAGAVMEEITDIDKTLKLAGQSGSFDLVRDFGVPEERTEALDISTQLAIGAGIEALRDAGIPLVMRYRRTSKGTLLPDGWKLPEAMQDETGVIFCSAFPGLNRMAEEADRFYSAQKLQSQLDEINSIEDLLLSLNPSGQTQFQAELQRRKIELEARIAEIDYHFDRRFVFRVLAMGHSQFAEYIGARGPNTSVNAACATTTHAVSVAEDWIRAGRCRRVVIIAGDDVTSENLASWIGTGLFASGAATTEADVRKAALPFDRRRNGLIMGMGAAALVIESQDALSERGIRPICEVVSSHIANSAFHGTRLDVQHVGSVMEKLVEIAEIRFGLRREEIASQLVFVSHETYTPARGGSASAEINALRQVFKEHANQVVIANTKGFTGHTMGVGIEDVMAVKALETGKVPPIAHIGEGFEPDPELGDLNLSRGLSYNPQFALRLGAGFGSQIAMVLFRKVPGAGERINHEIYDAWLAVVSGYTEAELEIVQRTLRVKSMGTPINEPMKTRWQFGQVPMMWAVPGKSGQGSNNQNAVSVKSTATTPTMPVPNSIPAARPLKMEAAPVGSSDDEIKAHVLASVSEKTGYPVEMLDLELDLEADLGIDTVKQAELFATIRTHYGIPRREDLRLSDYNSLEKVIGFVKENLAAGSLPNIMEDQSQQNDPVAAVTAQVADPVVEAGITAVISTDADTELNQFVLQTVSEKTGYPIEMLDLDLDLEADLGIDTVKQAELFATIRTHFEIPKREDLRLSEYNTLAKVIGFVRDAAAPAAATSVEPTDDKSDHSMENDSELGLSKGENPATMTGGLRRRVPQPVLLPKLELCLPTGVSLEGSRVLILTGRDKTAAALAKKLAALKAEVLLVNTGEPHESALEWIGKGPVLGMYCLTALDADPNWDGSREETWANALKEKLEPLFQLAKTLPANSFLVSATRMGGLHGFMQAANPLGGAVGGFTKAYRRERRGALARVVDFETKASADFIADCLIQETLRDPASLEVGREKGLRYAISLMPQTANPNPTTGFSSASVFVVSGGSGGITSSVVEDLARRSKGSFYLLSRTSILDVNPDDLKNLKADRTGFKQALFSRLSAGGGKVSPVQVEEKLAALERAGATRDLLERVRKLGGKVEYIQCNITDPASVSAAVGQIAQAEGRVDYLIHAAGVEKSRALESKSLEEFRQVVDVKAGGFMNLFGSLEKASRMPKSVVFFSSVAGRFGNAGQADYCAGNDFLSKLAFWLPGQYPETRFVSLDWGAWAEVGMASRGSIPTIMERAGIEMLLPAQAAPLVGDVFLEGISGEIVAAGALGMMERSDSPNHGLDVAAADAALRAGNPIHSMLSHLTGYSVDAGITLETTLDPQELAYLRDHAINGIPVMPGVVGIDGFSIAAKHISSVLASDSKGFEIERLEKIEFLTPIKFYGNKSRRIMWKAIALKTNDGLRIDVSLESDIERHTGKMEHFQHFKGLVYLTPGKGAVPETANPPKWDKKREVSSSDIYRLYFHGPSFQVLDAAQRSGTSVLGRFNQNLVEIAADEPGLFNTPLLIELCFQTAGLWEAGSTGNLGLPHSIGELKVYRKYAKGSAVYAMVQPKERDGHLSFDARVMDARGNVYLEMTDYCTTPLPYPADVDLVAPMKTLLADKN